VERLNRLFPLLAKFKLTLNLHHIQNLYFEVSQSLDYDEKPEWLNQFRLLGDNLGVKVE